MTEHLDPNAVPKGTSRTLINTREAARLLGVSASTIQRMVRRGELPIAYDFGEGAGFAFDRKVITDRLLGSTPPPGEAPQVSTDPGDEPSRR